MSFLSGMLNSWILGGEYQEWLKKLRAESQSAVNLGETKCLRCGYCCAVRPCIPTPEELKIIAHHLGMTVKEAVKKYFVGDCLGHGATKFIFPAKETQTDITGTFIGADRTWDKGYCIFFDKMNKNCIIHSIRPKMARLSNCWEDFDMKPLTEEILKEWEKVNISEYGIENCYGEEDNE